jgi:hypothetical protein
MSDTDPIVDPEPACSCKYCRNPEIAEFLRPKLIKTADMGYKRPKKTTVHNILTKKFGSLIPEQSSGVGRWMMLCEPLWNELWDKQGRVKK